MYVNYSQHAQLKGEYQPNEIIQVVECFELHVRGLDINTPSWLPPLHVSLNVFVGSGIVINTNGFALNTIYECEEVLKSLLESFPWKNVKGENYMQQNLNHKLVCLSKRTSKGIKNTNNHRCIESGNCILQQLENNIIMRK